MKIEILPLLKSEFTNKDPLASMVMDVPDVGTFVQVAKVNFVVDGVVVETKHLSVALHDRHHKIHLAK